MGQAKTLTERELKRVLDYIALHRHAARNRAMVLLSQVHFVFVLEQPFAVDELKDQRVEAEADLHDSLMAALDVGAMALHPRQGELKGEVPEPSKRETRSPDALVLCAAFNRQLIDWNVGARPKRPEVQMQVVRVLVPILQSNEMAREAAHTRWLNCVAARSSVQIEVAPADQPLLQRTPAAGGQIHIAVRTS